MLRDWQAASRGSSTRTRASITKPRRYARPMDQVVQVVGAQLILVAYAAAQFGALNQRSRVYLVLNLVGAPG